MQTVLCYKCKCWERSSRSLRKIPTHPPTHPCIAMKKSWRVWPMKRGSWSFGKSALSRCSVRLEWGCKASGGPWSRLFGSKSFLTRSEAPRRCARFILLYLIYFIFLISLSLLQFGSLLNQHFLRPQKRESCVSDLRGVIDAGASWMRSFGNSFCFSQGQETLTFFLLCLSLLSFGFSMMRSASCRESCVRFGCVISLSLPQTPKRRAPHLLTCRRLSSLPGDSSHFVTVGCKAPAVRWHRTWY